MFICTKKKIKCICLHTQKKEQNAYVYVYKILSDMHSFTYTQKKPPAALRAAEMHMFTCIHFSPHTINTQTPAGKKNKKVHTLYIHPKPHFQPAAALPTTPPLLSHTANLLAAGRNMTNHHQPLLLSHPYTYPHFAGSRIKYTTQQSQSHHNAATATRQKGYILTQLQAYTYFFAHFSRFLQNGRQGAYIRP